MRLLRGAGRSAPDPADAPPVAEPPLPPGLPLQIPGSTAVAWVESIAGRPLPIVRVRGWAAGAVPHLRLETASGTVLEPVVVTRNHRPDVAAAVPGTDPWCGFAAEFHLGPQEPVAVLAAGRRIEVPAAAEYGSCVPAYEGLLAETRVLGREAIYGQGPPTDTHPEILAFMESAGGPLLDFGCGNGDLVEWFRRRGTEAVGLELDNERISLGLRDFARPYVTLYDGGEVLPFPDAAFRTVVATEVLEHIPRVASLVPELARIVEPGGSLYVTVPDASSIPKSFPTATVPWHLLELTHVNFFTYASLRDMLRPHFEVVDFVELLRTEVNGLEIPGSLGARLVRSA